MGNEDLEGVVSDFGHQTSISSEPVCLSLETVCNTLHSGLIVAEIAGARLELACQKSLIHSNTPKANQLNA